MSLSADTIPTTVASAVLESLRSNLVFGNMFNENYSGEVAPGNAVKIPSIGTVNVVDYTSYTSLSDDEAADSSVTMDIDQQRAVSLVIDDIDEAMARPDIMGAYGREIAFQLQKDMDSYLAGLLAAGGTLDTDLGDDSTPLSVNSANVQEVLHQMARLLDEADVPRGGRAVVLPPWMLQDLVNANVNTSTGNTGELSTGAVARAFGFNVFTSTQVPNDGGDKYKIIGTSNIAATMAMAVNQSEILRHPTQFANKMRSLFVYGGKVTRPGAIAVATVDEAAE